jgi:hypothetical protein
VPAQGTFFACLTAVVGEELAEDGGVQMAVLLLE